MKKIVRILLIVCILLNWSAPVFASAVVDTVNGICETQEEETEETEDIWYTVTLQKVLLKTFDGASLNSIYLDIIIDEENKDKIEIINNETASVLKGTTISVETSAENETYGYSVWYTFCGWNDDTVYEEGAEVKTYTTTIDSDITIKANWESDGCFVKGTKITMSDWTTKNIEDVVKGDRVKSYNIKTNQYYDTTVVDLGNETIDLGYYVISLANGMQVKPTSNHPLLTSTGFKAIKQSIYFEALSTDDSLITINGVSKIESIEHINDTNIAVYWINVKDDEEKIDDDSYDTHLADGVIVHNGIYHMIALDKELGITGIKELAYPCTEVLIDQTSPTLPTQPTPPIPPTPPTPEPPHPGPYQWQSY